MYDLRFYNTTILAGSLGNTGLLAGLLLIVSPLLFYITNKKKHRFILVTLTLLIFLLIILTNSRAAIIAYLGTIHLILLTFKRYRRLLKMRKTFFTLISALIILIVVCFSFFKIDSINGRFFIWDVCLKNYKSFIVNGIGYGEFPVQYRRWQGDYFKSNDNSYFSYLADLPKNAFNEPLQILIELGTSGFIIFISIIIAVFRASTNFPVFLETTLKISLLNVLLFSFFSYPFHSFPILIYSVSVLGCLASGLKNNYIMTNYTVRFSYVIMLLIIPAMTYFIYQRSTSIATWNLLKKQQPKFALIKYKELLSVLDYNSQFLLDYGKLLHRNSLYQESTDILLKTEKIYSNIEIPIFIASNYQYLNDYVMAEKYLISANQYIPSKLLPKYMLLKLFIETRDTLNAINMAKHISETPLKVNSDSAFKMQLFAENYLLHLKH
ncbi:O-antigen ligase family protein [Pedobacter puniceum]|nr:O-antigen ligase family protein [Pedobacter puniceum]